MASSTEINGFDCADLHDAVLEQISVRWGKHAEVTFTMLPSEAYIKPSRPVTLVGKGLKRLVCPQENPWGPSDFVNRVQEKSSTDRKRSQIEIEMQSGDVICVEAEAFEVSVSDAGIRSKS